MGVAISTQVIAAGSLLQGGWEGGGYGVASLAEVYVTRPATPSLITTASSAGNRE
jgi:hypothetical protein